jgi:hypothetical protein
MAWKWTVRGLVFFVAGALIAAVIVYFSWTNPAAVRQQVLARLNACLPGATISLESARMKLLGGISVSELHLTRRDGQRNEFAYIPRATISLDKEMLSKGKVAIPRIEFLKPKLHVIREADGSWNVAGILVEPNPNQLVPMMVLKQATLVLEDRLNPPGLPRIEIKDADLTIINEPLSTLVFEGAGTSDLAGRIQIRGSWGRTSHEFGLSLEASDFPVDGNFVERLGPCCPQLAVHARQLTGTVSLHADLKYEPDAPEPWSHDVHLELSRGKLCHAQIPLPLENLEARCRCTDGRLTVERLTAQSGGTRLEASGRAMSLDSEADLEGNLRIDHLSVCSDVFNTLPDKLRAIQQDYNPEGFVDVTLEFQRKRGRWREFCQVSPRSVSMVCAKFPYRLEQVGGTIEHRLDQIESAREINSLNLNLIGYTSADGYTGAQEVHIEGKVEGAKPAGVDIRIWGKDIAIDEKLCTALVKPELQKLVRSFSPAGRVDIEAHIHRLQGDSAFANRYFIQFHEVLLSYEVFPYPVENVSGTLDIRPDYWEFRDFHGTHKGAEIRCRGRSNRRPGGSELAMTITGSNLPLDEELEGAVRNDALKRAWKTLDPAGHIDFEAQVCRTPEAPQPDIAVTVVPRGCRITPNFFPYSLSDLTGNVYYHQHEVMLSEMRARHGATTVSVEKGKIFLKPDGGVSVDMADLAANPSTADPDLVHALPQAVQNALVVLQSNQPFLVRTRITVDVPAEHGNPPYVYWDGELDLREVTLAAGVEIQHVTGTLGCRGNYQGGLQSLAGNIQLQQATVLGQPLQDIHSQILVNEKQPDYLDLGNLAARLFGGDVVGSVRVKYRDGIEYDLNLTASQIHLDELGRHNQLGPKARLSGLAGARIFLHGHGADVSGLEGVGSIDVPNGKMYNLPLLLDLLKVLSLRLPDETAFEEAHVRFGIHDRKVDFQRLDLFGNAVSLSGNGTMNLDGSDLNLDFFAVWGRVLQLLPPVIDQIPAKFAQSLLKIKMRGQVGGKVVCTKEPLPPLLEPIKEILKRMQGR